MENASGLPIDELTEIFYETIRYALHDKPSDMIVATHLCKGNYKSTYLFESGYEMFSKHFDNLGYDVYLLEFDDERSGGFEPLRNLTRKDVTIVLGLLTSKNGELEDQNFIVKRIKEASQYVPLEQLSLSTQCGFSSTEEGNKLTEEEQWNKVNHVIKIAESVWEKAPINQ